MWQHSRDRTVGLVRELDAGTADTTVPATPDWTVRELLAHMVGVDADAVAGTVPADLNPGWTQSHVTARAGVAVAGLVAEWDALTPAVLALFAGGDPQDTASVVLDAFIHEQDLRTALPGVAPVADDPAVRLGLVAFAGMFGERVRSHGLPAAELSAPGWSAVVGGEGEPGVGVRAGEFELLRGLTGRRSAMQVRDLSWTGDPEPYVEIFSAFGPLRDSDLHE